MGSLKLRPLALRAIRLSLVVVICLALSAMASAATLNIERSAQELYGQIYGSSASYRTWSQPNYWYGGGHYVQSISGLVPYSNWDLPGGLVTATQDSTISADGISGTGYASASASGSLQPDPEDPWSELSGTGQARALAYIDAWFTVSEDSTWRVSGSFIAGESSWGDVTLEDEWDRIWRFTAYDGSTPFEQTFHLTAGKSYWLMFRGYAFAEAEGETNVSSPLSYSLDFRQVPEPATLCLLGVGAIAAMRRGRTTAGSR